MDTIIKRSEVVRYLLHLGIGHAPQPELILKTKGSHLSLAPGKIYWKACPPQMTDIYG